MFMLMQITYTILHFKYNRTSIFVSLFKMILNKV